jgi:tRNA-specific 2-thiouridylase
MMKNNQEQVILGLSGGVDSTAAALFLLESGYRVTGLYFDVHPEGHPGAYDAKAAADALGIPFVYRNVHDEFSDTIIRYFCDAYQSGRTPNPCILCNPLMKFRVLAEEADRSGARFIATGHYARVREGRLYKAANGRKDQSYMLCRLPVELISRLILPLGEMQDKAAVRSFVAERGLFNASKKDSQEICFVPGDNYLDFLESRGESSEPGVFLDKEGRVLGRHPGIMHFTVGQRKGLGMTFGKPTYVIGFKPGENAVILGSDEDLWRREVLSGDHVFSGLSGSPDQSLEGRRLSAKIRYSANASPCTVNVLEDGRIRTTFEEPQRAPTPGQSIVFYEGEMLLGGGFIL